MSTAGLGEREARGRAGAMGRFGRNAMVQGAAAELFKVWAVTVRARAAALDARVGLSCVDQLDQPWWPGIWLPRSSHAGSSGPRSGPRTAERR